MKKREDFIFKELKHGQEIKLFGDDYEVYFNIRHLDKPGGYFLKSCRGDNDRMFKVIGKEGEHESFVKGVLGYYIPEGAFPYCKSLSDLTKLVNAIIREYNKYHIGLGTFPIYDVMGVRCGIMGDGESIGLQMSADLLDRWKHVVHVAAGSASAFNITIFGENRTARTLSEIQLAVDQINSLYFKTPDVVDSTEFVCHVRRGAIAEVWGMVCEVWRVKITDYVTSFDPLADKIGITPGLRDDIYSALSTANELQRLWVTRHIPAPPAPPAPPKPFTPLVFPLKISTLDEAIAVSHALRDANHTTLNLLGLDVSSYITNLNK